MKTLEEIKQRNLAMWDFLTHPENSQEKSWAISFTVGTSSIQERRLLLKILREEPLFLKVKKRAFNFLFKGWEYRLEVKDRYSLSYIQQFTERLYSWSISSSGNYLDHYLAPKGQFAPSQNFELAWRV